MPDKTFQQILADLSEISDNYLPRIAAKFDINIGLLEQARDHGGNLAPRVMEYAKVLLERATVKRMVMFAATDQLAILSYALAIASSDHGDPLKDTYEMGDDEPADPYRAVAEVSHTINQAILAARVR